MRLLDQVRGLRTSQLLLDTGEHLYFEGDSPSTAHTIYDGWIVLYRTSSEGHRQILRFALPGDFLGYKLGKDAVYDHSAKALSPVKLCTFPIQQILEKMTVLPELHIAIQSMNDAILERCHSSITTIASKSAEAKVAFLFVSLFSREESVRKNHSSQIPFPLTQEDMADALGLTSIHVNRVIKGLRNRGLITCKNRRLDIFDREELIKVAEMDSFEIQRFQ
jgi:CRP-like cAMP-binding protein